MDKIRKKIPIGLLLILVAFLTVSFVFGHYKAYLYEDEVLSYTAANSQGGLRPKFERYSLTDGKEFVRNALTADAEHRFDYSKVAENTSDDPHPPLYLFILHTISSLMPGVYSKWIALGINIVSGVFVIILLYSAAARVMEKKKQVIASVTAFAFSAAFIDKITFLRMYPLFTVFTTALFYQYLRLIDNKEVWKEKKNAAGAGILLLINVVAGTMTHYYFLIFAFFAAAFYSIRLLMRKDIRSFLSHLCVYALAAAASIALFPSMIWQISSSDPMSESSKGAGTAGVLIGRAKAMFVEFNLDFFNGYLKYFVLGIVFLLLYFYFYEKKRPEYRLSEKIIFTLSTAAGYILLVSLTTPYVSARYLAPAYPLLVLLIIYLVTPLLDMIFKNENFAVAVFTLLLVFPLLARVRSGLMDYNKLEMQRIAGEYSADYCITWSGMTLEENYFELEKYAGLYKMKLNDKDAPETLDRHITEADELVVYVPAGKDPEEYLNYLKKYVKGIDEYSLLYRAYYSDAYLMK